MNWKIGVAAMSDQCKNLNSPFVTLQLKVEGASGYPCSHVMELTVPEFQVGSAIRLSRLNSYECIVLLFSEICLNNAGPAQHHVNLLNKVITVSYFSSCTETINSI